MLTCPTAARRPLIPSPPSSSEPMLVGSSVATEKEFFVLDNVPMTKRQYACKIKSHNDAQVDLTYAPQSIRRRGV